ncbi:MAG: DUF2071 domain-containing protein [Actinomycetota bacterium]|nr:DUF2071 domain-containing protein [Actinomycetota bacterium]
MTDELTGRPGVPVTPEPILAEVATVDGRVVLRQRWAQLAAFHWDYDPAVVQAILPPGLRADTFDGRAWVGLIPFEMERVRFARGPVLPIVGSFVEVNVRTYVVDGNGRRAVWFSSLDVPTRLVVATARSVFALPYCLADATHTVDGHRHAYEVTRRWPRHDRTAAPPRARMEFTVGEPIPEPSELDRFLSARWALTTTRRNRLLRGPVGHPAWPLHRIEVESIDEDLIAAAGLPAPDRPPTHTAYSPGVDVEVGTLRRLTVAGA